MFSRLFFSICLCALSYVSADSDIDLFLRRYPSTFYQDVIVRNQIIALGTDLCLPRYEMIRPILDLYARPFAVLDLGAAQGYFSFNIAHNYPHSYCVMVDANNPYYSSHGDKLYDLCLLNHHLPNICYLNKQMTLSDLSFLHSQEHFDIVIAFLVVHMMDESLSGQIKIIESLLTLGDHVLLEVADNVAIGLTAYIEFLSTQMPCQYLGEVTRLRASNSPHKGKIFWFKMKSDGVQEAQSVGIKSQTFQQLNGVYP